MPVKTPANTTWSEGALEHTGHSTPTVESSAVKPGYTCPMHPEVQQDHPGNCPKCGMALELKTVTAGGGDEESDELRNMTLRFWIGAALALPVFVLAMAHMIPVPAIQAWVERDASRWIQFGLATPVV
jgi:Cu+-exporting ATPase